jgi:hypothetical protein
VEHDGIQAVIQRGKARFTIAIEAKRRVLQPCVEDVCVSPRDDLGIGRITVRDGQEARLEGPVAALEREIALV